MDGHLQRSVVLRLVAGLVLLGLLHVAPSGRDAGAHPALVATSVEGDVLQLREHRDDGRRAALAPIQVASPLTLEERAGGGGPDAEQRVSPRRAPRRVAPTSPVSPVAAGIRPEYRSGAVPRTHLYCIYRL